MKDSLQLEVNVSNVEVRYRLALAIVEPELTLVD